MSKTSKIVTASYCFCLAMLVVVHAQVLNFRGIMLGQNIEAAQTVFETKYGRLVETGDLMDGTFALGDFSYHGRHFTLDQTHGVVVADDLDRVQSITCRGELLEKIAGFPFADAGMATEWVVAELKLPGMDAIQAGRPALDPFTYEYRSLSTRPPYYIRVMPDKTMVIQSMKPNRRN